VDSNDPFLTKKWPWHLHLEYVRRPVSAQAAQIIKDIMDGVPAEIRMLVAVHDLDLLLAGEEATPYKYITQTVVDEWRWGYVYEVIIKDSDENFWGYTYKEQVGDEYWTSFSDTEFVQFYRVFPKEVVTTKYVRNPDDQ
jgi:hypothetical protein